MSPIELNKRICTFESQKPTQKTEKSLTLLSNFSIFEISKETMTRKVQGILDLREFCVHGRLRNLNFRVS